MIDPRNNYPPGVTGNEPEIAGPDFDQCPECFKNKFLDCECDRCEECEHLLDDCDCGDTE